MNKLIAVILVLVYSPVSFALFAPSKESAQSDLDKLYQSYFYKLDFNGKKIFSGPENPEEISSFFSDLHNKSAKTASGEGHWAYSVKKLPSSCMTILESGPVLPEDYKIKNRYGFSKKPFYKLVRKCEDLLSSSPALFSQYNSGLNELVLEMEKQNKREADRVEAATQARNKEQAHPNYNVYSEWVLILEALAKSNVFEISCKEENEYNSRMYMTCLNSEHGSLNLLAGSLENLWRNSNGRAHMDELLKLFEGDIEKSMKVIQGRPIPDMSLTKIRFRESLKSYFKNKGFSVYDAVAVLN